MENELLPFETHSIEDTKICVFGEETMTYINELSAGGNRRLSCMQQIGGAWRMRLSVGRCVRV